MVLWGKLLGPFFAIAREIVEIGYAGIVYYVCLVRHASATSGGEINPRDLFVQPNRPLRSWPSPYWKGMDTNSLMPYLALARRSKFPRHSLHQVSLRAAPRQRALPSLCRARRSILSQ